ncbi:MAG TPA: dienelactone hydrolase family protein [Mucilaginibacter sp.]|jgi:dienelactone hydrolase
MNLLTNRLSKIFVALLLLSQFCLFQLVKAQTDPYTPYLKSVPIIKQVISEINSDTGSTPITTRKFIYGSKNNENSVYAIMAYPQQQGKYPAIMFLHGGGSKAEDMLQRVETYARRGYVTFAFDMPGICSSAKTTNSSGSWKSRPGGEGPRFDIGNGLQNSTLVDAEVAGIEAFNFLSAQKNVDVKNIGITGFSWGGYSTTMLAGILGKKVKAAYSVFGCGYYEKGSFWTKMIAELPDSIRTPWLKYFDAGRRAKHIKAPYFLEASSNDTYFWPEAVESTLHAIHSTKNHVWDPNFNHKQMPAGSIMQQIYLDYYLKGIGQPFPTAKITREKIEVDSGKKIEIKIDTAAGVNIASVVLYYSEPSEKWQTRVWVPLVAIKENNSTYSVTIPASLVKKGVDYYACVTDDRQVSVASNMFNAAYGIKDQPGE